VEVAGANLGPGVGDSDQGFAQVIVAKANGLEHGASRRAVRPFGESPASVLEIFLFHHSFALQFGGINTIEDNDALRQQEQRRVAKGRME
jgi:hypothetical protein